MPSSPPWGAAPQPCCSVLMSARGVATPAPGGDSAPSNVDAAAGDDTSLPPSQHQAGPLSGVPAAAAGLPWPPCPPNAKLWGDGRRPALWPEAGAPPALARGPCTPAETLQLLSPLGKHRLPKACGLPCTAPSLPSHPNRDMAACAPAPPASTLCQPAGSWARGGGVATKR